MQWLYRIIGQVGIFLICAQTVVYFRPKESYDKYLKLLLSIMLLLQLLQPVLTMLGSGETWNVEEQMTGFTEGLQTVLTRASEQAGQTEEKVQNTANAVAENAGDGYGQARYPASAQTDNMEENDGNAPEESGSEPIQVEVGPIRLE